MYLEGKNILHLPIPLLLMLTTLSVLGERPDQSIC